MKRWFRMLRAAVLASLIFAPGRVAWAQKPVSTEPMPAGPVIMENGPEAMEYAAEPAGEAPPPEHHRLFPRLFANKPIRPGVKDFANDHGVGCFATIHTNGCSSLHSDLTFIFGSCRTFFGEPCLERPDGAHGSGCASGGCGGW